MYQGITQNDNIKEIFDEWFGRFHELEKDDVWKELTDAEKIWARQQEEDRLRGVLKPPDKEY